MTVSTHDHGRVRVLTLSRPQARNAMNTALLRALLAALTDAVADEAADVLVLTGTGGQFSAGADLREELDHDAHVRRMDLFADVYAAVATCAKPTLAAIEGACVGGGVEVAAACDLRIADPTARFRFPGATLGIPIGAAKLVGLVGLGSAKDLVFTSRTFTTDEAARLGFVQRVANPGGALALALEVGAQIAASSQPAIRYVKRQFDRFSGLGERVAAENTVLHALAEAGGDLTALPLLSQQHRVPGRDGR